MAETRREPVVCRIADNLVTVLGQVLGTPYWSTLATAADADIPANVPANLTPIVALESDEPSSQPDRGRTQSEEWHEATYSIVVPAIQTSTTAPWRLLARVWADIVAAVRADRTRGGLADNTEPAGMVMTENDEVVVLVRVSYRIKVNDLTYSASLAGG